MIHALLVDQVKKNLNHKISTYTYFLYFQFLIWNNIFLVATKDDKLGVLRFLETLTPGFVRILTWQILSIKREDF